SPKVARDSAGTRWACQDRRVNRSELTTARVSRSGPKSLASSMERISASRPLARFTRLLMVPTAHPQIRAASSYEKPDAPTSISASRCSGGSDLRASRNSLISRRVLCSGEKGSCSAYVPSTSSTSRRRLRYSERNRLRRMVNSHADILVPGSKDPRFANARSSASCTRSSARSTLPHNEMANARKLGTAASITSRMFLFGLILRALVVARVIEAAQDIYKTFGHPLADDIVVDDAQLLANFCLDLSSEFGHRFHIRSLQLHRLSSQ